MAPKDPGCGVGDGPWPRRVSAVLFVAWWAFRPEKLWVNKKVSEPAPFSSTTDPQPLYTGQLEGKAHQTSGRATIYKAPDGEKDYVRLTRFHDFEWSGRSRSSSTKRRSKPYSGDCERSAR